MSDEELPGFTELWDLDPDPVTRVETLNSYWLLDGSFYVRTPKSGASRGQHASLRLRDAERLPYVRAYWAAAAWGEVILRIKPDPPVGSGTGLWSSAIIAVEGDGAAARLARLLAELGTLP